MISTTPSYLTSAAIIFALFATGVASQRFARPLRLLLFAAIIAQIVALNASLSMRGPLLFGLTLAAFGCAAIAIGAAILPARQWYARARDPIVLAPPFEGAWRVAAGGPFPGLNHHMIAKDQYFAYDFVRVGGVTFGSTILSPIDGRVTSASDGMEDRAPTLRPDHPSIRGKELGNHVVITTDRGSIFLCHLRKNSVCVHKGQIVRAGDAIGECGNSGRTTRSHVHVHAQDQAKYAYDRANGLPIAFQSGARTKLLRPFGVLSGR